MLRWVHHTWPTDLPDFSQIGRLVCSERKRAGRIRPVPLHVFTAVVTHTVDLSKSVSGGLFLPVDRNTVH
jgi:hypothetical protein